jgi:aminopeptidase N
MLVNQVGRLMKYFLFLLFLPVTSFAVEFHSDVFHQFRQSEQQNWIETIQNARSVSNDSSIDIRFYHINIDVAVHKKYIQSTVLVRFDAQIDNLTEIKLDLQRSFHIDSLTGAVSSFQFNNDVLNIFLDRSYNAGDSASIRIYYHGEPPIINDLKGLRYETHGFNEPIIANLSTPFLAHYWWPCKDGPGDKADSVYIDISIPDTTIRGIPLIAVSNGTLAGTSTAGSKKTFHWRERFPIVPYYVNIVISNYTPFRQWSGGAPRKGVSLEYNVFNETREAALDAFADFADVLTFFESLFGPYPFKNEKYAMCELGYYGGIEKQTNTIMGGMTGGWFGVAVHELAHMWFADMITCQSWHHAWLNEGFATYAEALWYEHLYGETGYTQFMQNIQFFDGGSLYLPDPSDPFQVFVGIIYNKGAWVLHMLRGVLGDETFFNALKNYAMDERFRFDHATTKDFQQVCETTSGQDLNLFFEQWIYDAYFPFYQYSFSQDETTSQLTLRIDQIQGDLGRRQVFDMPVQLLLEFSDGSDSLVTVQNNQKKQDFLFDVDRAVIDVQLDPNNWILHKSKLVTNVATNPQPPGTMQLYPNYPNPFNSSTTIRFQCQQRAHVNVSVRNLRGQHIKTLVDDTMDSGEHRLVWDGQDENGERLPSGLYFVSLQSADYQKTIKTILLE